MPLNLAANLSFMFTELPFEQRFDAAAKAGFRGVEFLFPYAYAPEDIAKFIKDAGVTLALHNLPPGDWEAGERGLAGVLGRQSDFRASLDTALLYCAATGLKQLHIMAGCTSQTDRAKAWDLYLENLSIAAKLFAPEGITALIEPINSKDMPGYLLNHVSDAQSAIRAVNAPNLKLQFDCYHAQIMGGDALGSLKSSFADIAHIQIASVPDRHEPDHGDCNYSAIFAALETRGYQGWIGCEYHPEGATLEGLDWFTDYIAS